MTEAVIDRLLHTRRVALGRDDLGLLLECDAALMRLGIRPPPVPTVFANENAIVPTPPETAALRRTRVRSRSMPAPTDEAS